MFDNKDFMSKFKEAWKMKTVSPYKNYILAAAALAVGILVTVVVVTLVKNLSGSSDEIRQAQANISETGETLSDSTGTPEQQAAFREREEIEKVVSSYQNLGIVQVTGYLNVRKEPNISSDIVAKLYGDSACEILSTENEWYKISSGQVEGYIHSQFILSGQEAKDQAKELVKLRAIVRADKLNIREEPGKDSDVKGQVYMDERYEVKSQVDGWVEISSGFLSTDYVEVQYCLNEARKLDLKSMVLNLYDNLGISNVDSYLNVREKPSEDSKIIAKLPSKSACDVLENQDGWLKIHSGDVTGYVKSDYILTGSAAKDLALETAELMAVVFADCLNVRTEPSTDAKIWTQISNKQKYAVLSQTDGWVEIELDTTSAYVSTDFVDVQYALPEAIKFSPMEEKSNAQTSLRSQIVNYAMQFLGNPYVWGGTSLTKGADCSGFTMSVLGKYGVKLPHYSVSQSKMGKTVKSSEMRPGDLIFYTDKKGTINHVAMYIGNGQVVHAANRRSGIKISTWNYRNPVKIRNVID